MGARFHLLCKLNPLFGFADFDDGTMVACFNMTTCPIARHFASEPKLSPHKIADGERDGRDNENGIECARHVFNSDRLTFRPDKLQTHPTTRG